MPLPVCKSARASRNKKVKGTIYYGHCAAKKEKFFGFRLHLIVDPDGIPVSFVVYPASYHDIRPMYEITYRVPKNSIILGDKAYNCEFLEKSILELGIILMPTRRKNMKKQWSPQQKKWILSSGASIIFTKFMRRNFLF